MGSRTFMLFCSVTRRLASMVLPPMLLVASAPSSDMSKSPSHHAPGTTFSSARRADTASSRAPRGRAHGRSGENASMRFELTHHTRPAAAAPAATRASPSDMVLFLCVRESGFASERIQKNHMAVSASSSTSSILERLASGSSSFSTTMGRLVTKADVSLGPSAGSTSMFSA